MSEVPLELDYRPRYPTKRDHEGIGCVGAGFIMADCHLVAYRNAGFRPVAIASRSRERAAEVARRHEIAHVHDTWRDLLDDPAVTVVDVAVPPHAQPEVIEEAARRPHIRGILAQKPLALSYAEAERLVRICESAGKVLAVNQNMRYDASMRALRDLLRRGILGDPVLATIDMRAIPHWMDWVKGYGKLSFYVMSIHHLDCFRFLFGDPERVLASARPDPRTKFPHQDGIDLYILEYASGLRCCGIDDVWAGPAREGAAGDIRIEWRVEGTDGLAEGRIGWPSYPEHTPSTLRYSSKKTGEQWIEPRWDSAWFPDAFEGTMAELLVALETGSEPELSGRDNLGTMALVECAYRGALEHRVMSPSDITGAVEG